MFQVVFFFIMFCSPILCHRLRQSGALPDGKQNNPFNSLKLYTYTDRDKFRKALTGTVFHFSGCHKTMSKQWDMISTVGISKDTCGCVCRPLIVYENTFINNIQLLIELTVLRCNKWIGNILTIKWRTFTQFIWIWMIDPERFEDTNSKMFPFVDHGIWRFID